MMEFGTGPTKQVCKVCNEVIDKYNEKTTIEGYVLHNKCFTCGICDAPLKHGCCARDHGVSYVQAFGKSRQAPLWFCPDHMMLGSGEKMQLLKKKAAGQK